MTDEVPASAPLSAGAQLRAARESAGLSLDAVAQQLKLAPRQVQALEDDDYTKLPGRTFVRGFIRNYARSLHLDSDALLALLPDTGDVRSLDRPTLGPGPRRMGELPADAPRSGSLARWLIPLFLVIVIAAAVVYEFTRPQSESRLFLNRDKADTVEKPAAPSASGARSDRGSSVNGTAASGTSTTPLPNPMEDAKSGSDPSRNAPDAPLSPPAPSSQASPNLMASMATTTTTGPGSPLLTLDFRGDSWVEIRDRNGSVLYSQTGRAGTTQAIAGSPPLDVIVGKADAVALTFRGQPVSLAAFQKQNVARISLK